MLSSRASLRAGQPPGRQPRIGSSGAPADGWGIPRGKEAAAGSWLGLPRPGHHPEAAGGPQNLPGHPQHPRAAQQITVLLEPEAGHRTAPLPGSRGGWGTG
ncbi:Protein Aknad1 [Manis pentadactyla]|nr:Protein Aknad1 [Manis pentadactyla]